MPFGIGGFLCSQLCACCCIGSVDAVGSHGLYSSAYLRLFICFVIDLELLHFFPQILPADAERSGCFKDMPAVTAQDVLNEFLFACMKIFIQ